MTLDEAKHVGHLASALEAAEEVLTDINALDDSEEWLGVGLCRDVSSSGAIGVGPEVIVPPELAVTVMEHLRELLCAQLEAFGVVAKPAKWATP